MFLARSSFILLIFKMIIGQSTLKTISKDYFPDVEYPASVSEVEPFYYKPSERDLFDSLGTEIKRTTFANVTEVRDNKPISGVNNNDFTKSRSNHINAEDRNNKISLSNNREELINGTSNIGDAINKQEVNNEINKIADIKSIQGVENDLETKFNNLNIHNSRPSLRVLRNNHAKDNNSNIIYEYTTPSMILNVTSNSTYDTSNDLAAEDITVEAVAVVQVYLNPVLKNSDDEDDTSGPNSGPDEYTLGTPNHINIKTYALKENNILLETEDYVKNNDKPTVITGNTNKTIEEVAQNIETDVGQVASNVDGDKLQNSINTKTNYSQIDDISSNKTKEEIIQNIDSDVSKISNVDSDVLENSISTITASSQISENSSNQSMEVNAQNNESDGAQISNADTDDLDNSMDTITAFSQISEISSNKLMEEIVQNNDSDVAQISNVGTDELKTPKESKTAYSQISGISSNQSMEVNAQNNESDGAQISNADTNDLDNSMDTISAFSQISEISSNKLMEEIVQNNDSDLAQISNVGTDELKTPKESKTAYSQISGISSNQSMEEIVQNIDSGVTQMSSSVDTNELETSIDTKTANSQISEISSNNTNAINVKDTKKNIKSQNDGEKATQNDIVPTSDVAVLDAPQKNNTIGHLLYIGTQDLDNAKNLVYLGKYTQPLKFLIKRA